MKDFVHWISSWDTCIYQHKKANSCVTQVIITAYKTVNLSVWSWFIAEWNKCLFSCDWTVSFQNDLKKLSRHEHLMELCYTDTRIVWHKEWWFVWHRELWTVWLESEVIQSQAWLTDTVLSKQFFFPSGTNNYQIRHPLKSFHSQEWLRSNFSQQ